MTDHQLRSQTPVMGTRPGRGRRALPAPSQRFYPRKDAVVLAAAERTFLELGYAGTSMDAVALQAGVSKRTIYSNFRNKQELFAAVIGKRCAQVLPHALEGVDLGTTDPEAALCALATAFLAAIFSKPQVQLYQTAVAASRQFPPIGKMMFDGPILQTQQIFDRFLRAQAALGHLAFADIDVAAAQLIALLKTNLHMRLLFNQKVPKSREAIADSARASVRLFLHGALPRPPPTTSEIAVLMLETRQSTEPERPKLTIASV